MKRTLTALVILLTITAGCASQKQIGRTNLHQDSTRVEIQTVYIEKVDTVLVPLEQSNQTVILQDTTSYLENQYCTSLARITTDGDLMHDLHTKKEKIPVQTITKEIVRDSIVYRDRVEFVENTVEVKKPYSTFEKIEIIGFWILLAGVAIVLILTLKK